MKLCVCLQNVRALENSLEKTQFKCKEAENIMINYLKLKGHLQVCPTWTFLPYFYQNKVWYHKFNTTVKVKPSHQSHVNSLSNVLKLALILMLTHAVWNIFSSSLIPSVHISCPFLFLHFYTSITSGGESDLPGPVGQSGSRDPEAQTGASQPADHE